MIEMIFSGNTGPITLPDSTTTVTGEIIFDSAAGEQSWVVPTGVYDIQAVLIACGGVGLSSKTANGGRGGDLRWINRLAVTPGETLLISAPNQDTVMAYIKRGTTILIQARGGRIETASTAVRPPYIGGGNGGLGGVADIASNTPGGGGGAAGYSGDGGQGGTGSLIPGSPGNGGGGGGGVGWTFNSQKYGGGGGGIGLFGEGANGQPGTYNPTGGANTGGLAGSGGGDASSGTGGKYGGGAGSGSANTYGRGAVRIIWGGNRSFPNNAAKI